MPASFNLRIAASADAPLTPEQRKFNQLVAKLEKLRAELLVWQEHAPLFAQAQAQRVRPLLAELRAQRHGMAVKLGELAAGKGWTPTQRRTLRELVCDLCADLIDDETCTEAEEAELKALFDKHSSTSYDHENREALAEMKSMVEAYSGVHLGDEEFESEEAIMRRAHERVAAQSQAREEANEKAPRKRAKPPTAAQRRREKEEREATQSLREVFRKLASALHPDRADDESDRVRRTVLMQRVNEAYNAKDLLALFALQLEIEQVDAAHLAQATAERARHYNRVLSEQVKELEAELRSREMALCAEFDLDPFLRPNPKYLGALIEQEVRGLRAAVADVRRDIERLDDPAAAKRWLTKMRKQRQAWDHDDPFGPGFGGPF